MIFVTVGTHEQPFDRLIRYIDQMKRDGRIQEEVMIQTGFCTYEPRYCGWSRMLPYARMIKYVEEARIVITHGGPASFIMPLQMGKMPIVVPRQYAFGEHVNDHQVDFVEQVSSRMGNIIPVLDMHELDDAIKNYQEMEAAGNAGMSSNNERFNQEFEKLVEQLM